jgi:hypothetical protein
MSWAFLETMRNCNGNASYVDILRITRFVSDGNILAKDADMCIRGYLKDRYEQIPQLSCGEEIDLDQPFQI